MKEAKVKKFTEYKKVKKDDLVVKKDATDKEVLTQALITNTPLAFSEKGMLPDGTYKIHAEMDPTKNFKSKDAELFSVFAVIENGNTRIGCKCVTI